MKKYIIILLTAAIFGGCLPEGDAGCPEYMTLRFDLQDKHDPGGDFDSRIASDVRVYVFRDGKIVHDLTVPYGEIRGDGAFTFRKTLRMHGNLTMMAWTVADGKGDAASIPDWIDNDELEHLYLELPARTGPADCRPMACELYSGKVVSSEAVDVSTEHLIPLNHTACRVEVHVVDNLNKITTDNPRVAVHGSMNRMNMNMEGFGDEAVVHTPLHADISVPGVYNSGRFGILPSQEYQTLAVEIYDDNRLEATLKIPRDNLPRGASAGDLIVFDYRLGDVEFWLTVNGFRQKIVIVDGI